MSEKYLPQTNGDVSMLDKWSYFEEFYKNCKPKKNNEGEQLEENFVEWMIQGKFKKGEQVRYLPRILKNPRAFGVFQKENAEAARRVVELALPELGSRLYKAVVTAA